MKVDVEGKGGDGDEREELRSWSGDIYQSIPPLLETLIPSLTRRARF